MCEASGAFRRPVSHHRFHPEQLHQLGPGASSSATQHKSLSLNRHIRMGWNVVSEELGEFIEILPPQKRVGEHWYLGTADAVFQNLYSIARESPSHVIVLSGDHVYKMDYSKMLRFHLDRNADATLAALEVPVADSSRFGIVSVDQDERVTGFLEKPEYPTPPWITWRRVRVDGDPYLPRRRAGVCPRRGCCASGHNTISDATSFRPCSIAHRCSCIASTTRTRSRRNTGATSARSTPTSRAWTCARSIRSSISTIRNGRCTYQPQAPPAKFVFAEEGSRCGQALDSVISNGCIISGSRVGGSILRPNVRVRQLLPA